MSYKKKNYQKRKNKVKRRDCIKEQEKIENKHTFDRKMEYADKPVNVDLDGDRIDLLRRLCFENGLKLYCVGMKSKLVEDSIKYLRGDLEKNPSLYDKYITKIV